MAEVITLGTWGGAGFDQSMGVPSLQIIAENFTLASNAASVVINTYLAISASPTDNLTYSIQGDSGGNPNGTPIASGSISHTSLTGTVTNYNLPSITGTFLSGVTYWVTFSRSGAADGTNFYKVGLGNTGGSGGIDIWNGSAWDKTAFAGYTLTQIMTFQPATSTNGNFLALM